MATFPYSPSPNSIPKFLKHIQAAGVPPKVTQQYLVSVGFKSTNDRYLIAILKAVRFLDTSGAPSQSWRDYRDKGRARAVLGAAIRAGYAELFSVYPDADRKDAPILRDFFSTRTEVAVNTLDLAVRTFRTLCAEADFPSEEPAPSPSLPDPSPVEHNRRGHVATEVLRAKPASLLTSVNLNIQLQLPATDDASIYDKLFAAMRKHLLDGD